MKEKTDGSWWLQEIEGDSEVYKIPALALASAAF